MTTTTEQPPKARFLQLVDDEMQSSGCKSTEARLRVAKAHPELVAAMHAQANEAAALRR